MTKTMEAVLAGSENLKKISSVSRENVSFISMEFSWGADITGAANNARDLLELVKSRLPDEARNPIIYKVNSSMMPVVIYAVTAKENYYGLDHILEDNIASPLRKTEGVGTVIYLGQPEREILVTVDPDKLDAYNLSMQQIATVMKAQNISIPGGSLKTGISDYALRIPGEIESLEVLKDIPLTAFMGRVVRLGDIAEIEDGYRETDEYARMASGKGAALMVQKQSGQNSLEVIRQVRARMEEVLPTLPDDVRVEEVLSTEELISESIGNLSSTIWYALIFVVLVVLAFLREWRGSLIVVLTIPFSLISAFVVMYFLGWTINIFSLLSLVIAIGMVVDNAIVVLENITRHREQGDPPRKAAIEGATEMGNAIAASTLSTLMVFVPLVFTGGIVGILFKQLAVLTSVCLLVSLFTALSLTPVISSLLLLISSLLLTSRIGSDYIPNFDAGDVAVVFNTETGTSAAETDRVAQKIMKVIEEEVPERVPGTLVAVSGQTQDGALTTVGFSEGKNVGTVLCHLSLPGERERSAAEIGEVLREKIALIPEVEKFHVAAGNVLQAALLGNKKPVEVNFRGKDLEELGRLSSELKAAMGEAGMFTDLESTADNGKPEYQVITDRERASAAGLNAAMLAMQVRQAVYGTEAGSLSEAGENYDIRLLYPQKEKSDPEALENIVLNTLMGTQVRLGDVAGIVEGTGPVEIRREAQERVVTLKADLAPGIALGDAEQTAAALLEEMDIPFAVEAKISGQTDMQEESFSDLYRVLGIAVLLVYMIMAAQFESFRYPFIVMLSVPFTLIGVIWAFLITDITLSVTTFIGIIMLIGIVVNNGIVLVDYTNLLRKRGLAVYDAVIEAGRSRMRPVLMTSFTTILAMLPMAMSQGMGREMFVPMGITIIGGLLLSTLITLIMVPVFYSLFNRKAE